MTTRRSLAALVAALCLALSVSGTALAASDSSTTSETLSVQSQITLDGIPATLDYGSDLAGSVFARNIPAISVSTNAPSGFTLVVDASALTGPGGTIPSTSRSFTATGDGGCTLGALGAYAGTPMTLCSATSAGSTSISLVTNVNTNGAVVPGVYSGTLVFTATEN